MSFEITHVKQKGNFDCGLACLAMVTQQPYRQVQTFFNSVNWEERDPHGLSFGELILGLEQLGNGFLSAHSWDVRLKRNERRFRMPWQTLPGISIAAVNGRNRADFHWVVYDSRSTKIYDPADNAPRDPDLRTFVWGYIQANLGGSHE